MKNTADEYSLHIDIRGQNLKVVDSDSRVVADYPVICGRKSLEGHKFKEGDERTPRGQYNICTINERSEFTIFYGISYPNTEDALRGLREDLISQEEFEAISRADQEERRPPWDTGLGGKVGIHGGGIDRDGTQGCIGMRDQDALALKKYISVGIPVNLEY